MLQDSNPNVTNILFCDDKHVTFINDKGRLLRENRNLFISANARHRYAGYAHSQLKRMKNHNKWINNPQPEDSPHIKNYCTFINCSTGRIEKVGQLDEYKVDTYYPVKYNAHTYSIFKTCSNSKVKCGIFETKNTSAIREHDSTLMSEIQYLMIVDRQNFERDLDDWSNYWKWKNNRNEIRSELEEKHGYDTKHASHAIRLMRMGLEILKFGIVNVYRHEDREELLAIRNGAWAYERILEEAKKLDDEAELIYQSKTYIVPYAPDKIKINELYKQLIL